MCSMLMIFTHPGNTYVLSSYNMPDAVSGTDAATLNNNPFMEPTSERDQTILGLLFFPRHKMTLIMQKNKVKNVVLIEWNSRDCLPLLARGDQVLRFFVYQFYCLTSCLQLTS